MDQKKVFFLYLLAVVCFVLGFYGLAVYTAIRFTGFLFCCAGVLLLVVALLNQLIRSGKQWAFRCRKALYILLAAGVLLFSVMEIWVLQWARTDESSDVSAVVIFGAGVNGTVPSLSLQVRLQAALDYIQDKPDIPIVVSGSRGPGEDMTEARCMADWLIARGVDARRILLEEKADNTEENVRFSRQLLVENGIDPLSNIAYVTADYHLCRAVYLTGGQIKLTYEQGAYPYVIPVAAKMPDYFWPLTANYFIREAFAMAAEVLLPS